MAKIKFPKITAKLVEAALKLVSKIFINKLPDELSDVKAGLNLSIMPVSLTVQALADDNERNAEQIREIWQKFFNEKGADFLAATAAKNIDKIPQENIRVPVAHLLAPVTGILKVLTDENPDNKAQVEAAWKAFLSDPQTARIFFDHLFETLLGKVVKDPETVEFISQLIEELVKPELPKPIQ